MYFDSQTKNIFKKIKNLWYFGQLLTHKLLGTFKICSQYSSNEIRKTQNEHMNIVCQNSNSQYLIMNLMLIS